MLQAKNNYVKQTVKKFQSANLVECNRPGLADRHRETPDTAGSSLQAPFYTRDGYQSAATLLASTDEIFGELDKER